MQSQPQVADQFGGQETGEANEATRLLPADSSRNGEAHCEADGGDVGSLAALREQFGTRFLIMLFASQHLMKGFAYSFTSPPQQFLYASYKVPGPQIQIYQGVTQLPWAMKPVLGLLSDAFPIYGFNKMPYMVLTTLLGLGACAAVGLLPPDQLDVWHAVSCFFLVSLMYSTVDLLTEAKYAEKMQSKPRYGPTLMTFVWGGLTIGSLFSTALVGPVIRHWGAKMPFVLALLPIGFLLIPLFTNCMEETTKTDEQVAKAQSVLLRQYEACALCFVIFVGTIVLTVLGITYQSATVNAVAAIVVALVMLFSFSIVLRPITAKVNAFALVQTSVGFSIQGAAFYFYTNGPEEYPEGPHFSEEFYVSVLGVFGGICSLIGVYTYQRYLSSWNYQSLLIMTNLVLSGLSLLDVILFSRLNVRLGIPDHYFVVGSGALFELINQWKWMPGVVIMSQLCPEGMEAIMYALLAGCHNLGNTIASNCGALVLEWLEVQPNGSAGESKQFENLWIASLLSTLLPAITIILIPWLIPDAKQTEKLLPPGDRGATTGSLLQQWRGQTTEL